MLNFLARASGAKEKNSQLFQKDITLIVKECKKLGINSTEAEGLQSLFEEASKKYPNCDFASVYNIINPQ
jgi:hypothetical protein